MAYVVGAELGLGVLGIWLAWYPAERAAREPGVPRAVVPPMYRIQDSGALVSAHRTLLRARAGEQRVARTVVLLGLASLLTDISAEMVAAVLPLYLVYVAGLTPLQFGLIDGFHRGAAAPVGLASGYAADRRRRHKEVAAVGYGLSAACKLALVGVGGAVSAIGAIVMLDRIGKGIRTAPRDALISLSSSREGLGVAFGVHRAMDTTGAMLGPLLAFGCSLSRRWPSSPSSSSPFASLWPGSA